MVMFDLVFALYLFAFVSADKKNFPSAEPDLSRPVSSGHYKTSEKRWIDGGSQENSRPVLNKFARIDGEEMGINQNRALEEKTLRDFIPTDAFQNILVKIFKPQAPIVDTALYSEKNAPNHGNGAEALGDFIVKSADTISRALSTVLDVPKKAFGQLSTGATEALNQIGAYIVGL